MADIPNRPAITPDMKVGDLLDAYPELEEVLISVAPAFKKLQNPVLRKTIAKLTSIRQAAQVGGVSLGEIMCKLSSAAGVENRWGGEESDSIGADVRPEWVEGGVLVETLDAVAMIEGGGHPLPEVMSALRKLEPDEMYAIITPFVPAPMINKAREAGFQAWSEKLGQERFKTFFMRRPS